MNESFNGFLSELKVDDYFVLNIKGLSAQTEDWLSRKVFAHGALGISEVLEFDQPEGEEEVFTKVPEQRSVDVYFSTRPAHDFLSELNRQLPEAEFRVEGQANQDWLEEWKKGFAPFALVENYWVVPSWCEPPAPAKHKIWIDPGMAFGTGTHETTQLVARMMGELIAKEDLKSCLDVGTGTGILAILARQMGIENVRATEIEVDSRRVAKENFARNEASTIVLNEAQVEDLNETFALVTANIIDGVLVRIQEALQSRVRPGGWLVVSGIISEREADFLAGFHLVNGKTWTRREQLGDWVLFAAKF